MWTFFRRFCFHCCRWCCLHFLFFFHFWAVFWSSRAYDNDKDDIVCLLIRFCVPSSVNHKIHREHFRWWWCVNFSTHTLTYVEYTHIEGDSSNNIISTTKIHILYNVVLFKWEREHSICWLTIIQMQIRHDQFQGHGIWIIEWIQDGEGEEHANLKTTDHKNLVERIFFSGHFID